MCSSACITPRRIPSFTMSRSFSGVFPTADAVIWCRGTVAWLCCSARCKFIAANVAHTNEQEVSGVIPGYLTHIERGGQNP